MGYITDEIANIFSRMFLRNYSCKDFEFVADWDYITQWLPLSGDFILKFKDKLNWDNVCQFQQLDHRTINEANGYLNWDLICKHQILNTHILEEFKDKINWDIISDSQILNESFMERHFDRLNIDKICSYQSLSEKFIEKFKDRLNWSVISKRQKLSLSFMSKYKNLLDWNHISKYQTLSETFIKKFKHFVNWDLISLYQKLSEQFIIDNINLVNRDNIARAQNLSSEFINTYKNEFNFSLAERNIYYGHSNYSYSSCNELAQIDNHYTMFLPVTKTLRDINYPITYFTHNDCDAWEEIVICVNKTFKLWRCNINPNSADNYGFYVTSLPVGTCLMVSVKDSATGFEAGKNCVNFQNDWRGGIRTLTFTIRGYVPLFCKVFYNNYNYGIANA